MIKFTNSLAGALNKKNACALLKLQNKQTDQIDRLEKYTNPSDNSEKASELLNNMNSLLEDLNKLASSNEEFSKSVNTFIATEYQNLDSKQKTKKNKEFATRAGETSDKILSLAEKINRNEKMLLELIAA